jgi:hypothetical protein
LLGPLQLTDRLLDDFLLACLPDCCQLPRLLPRSPGGTATHPPVPEIAPAPLCPPPLLVQERKSLIGQKLNEKHNNWGSMLLGLGVTISVSGAFNTFLRTGGCWVQGGGWEVGRVSVGGVRGCCVYVGAG